MATPVHERDVAKREPAKLAKQLQIYTTQKVINKEFSKKKYRTAIGQELIRLSIETYVLISKSYYVTSKARAYELQGEALACVYAMSAQLETANIMYQTPIDNVEYLTGLILDLQESIETWMKNFKNQ